jgi:dienelactone hydrolase
VNPLATYEVTIFEHKGRKHRVYRKGNGPVVLVLHEMPGLHPQVISFADRLVDAGYRVYLPHLFGRDGAEVPGGLRGAMLMAAAGLEICLAQQFRLFLDRTSPAVSWLRALASAKRAESARGVGVVGMCITGGFALAMAVEEAVVAPVLSEPSLPVPLGGSRAAIGIDDDDLKAVRERARKGLGVLGLRFTEDFWCRCERFERLKRQFGTRFEAIEINSSRGNAWQIPPNAHAVLTVAFDDREGHPTRDALKRVISFLDERLK